MNDRAVVPRLERDDDANNQKDCKEEQRVAGEDRCETGPAGELRGREPRRVYDLAHVKVPR